MTRLERWCIAALLVGMCASCLPPRGPVPIVARPDTRRIWFVHLDSAALHGTLTILQAALPNETSVCYYGNLADTTVATDNGEVTGLILHLRSVREGVADSANLYHVYYSKPGAGCDRQAIAAGHSHPYAEVCDQSDDDSGVLFENSQFLVSLAWCAVTGEVQVFWQDGRRKIGRWRS